MKPIWPYSTMILLKPHHRLCPNLRVSPTARLALKGLMELLFIALRIPGSRLAAAMIVGWKKHYRGAFGLTITP